MRRLRAPDFGIVQRAEAQRIEHRDGARPHGENIAQDAAHARGRALKRLDKAGMVVRFDLEGDHVAAANIDDARVFAGPLHHQFAARRQLLQMQPRTLIGAVLAPHHAEDAQFRVVRLAAQNLDDLAVFRFGELVLGDQVGRDRDCSNRAHIWSAATELPRITIDRNSDQSVTRPHQRLGGALGVRHHAHHVASCVQNAGDVAHRAVGIIQIAERHAVFSLQFVERALVGHIAAFAVGDRQTQDLSRFGRGGERRIHRFGAQPHFAADEFQVACCASARRATGPASTRIWKPLQMPSTRPPSAANLRTAVITGENLAIAPQRR